MQVSDRLDKLKMRVPPDVTFSNPIAVPTASVDPLTILPHSGCNISDSDVSSDNNNSSKNQYENIDEESFVLLGIETLKSLITKSGPRLKFKKYLNYFFQTTNFYSELIFDSRVPPDVTFSNPIAVPTASVDPLTILPHSGCNISDSDVSSDNNNSSNNQCNIVHDLSLNDSESLFYSYSNILSFINIWPEKKLILGG
ncbi:hypothetical protein NPIL_108121 [Nephila pilipes]|uniref:Uncharacterized protein n=1 Tax=Nephila pilipes TaxID=299642 RepID=A0A8X6T903_NEPPI|nr:hypothetical protein NPIL_108121 [Nephila pilipes]